MENQNFEETAEKVHVTEEAADDNTTGGNEKRWTEEFMVAGSELLNTIKQLVHEANVRRIVIKNNDKRILFELPLVLGVAGVAILPWYAAVGLIAALVTDCSISVERAEKSQPAETVATA